MADGTRRRTWVLAGLAVVVLLLVAWAVARMRGPVLPGYEVASGPLVQNVVATGRVAALSRVQVGAEIAGLVLERRVMEGDRVAPGDVLVLLRARDLEARRDEARAALATLREAERPDAEARLRQARADLAQAERDLARRRELGRADEDGAGSTLGVVPDDLAPASAFGPLHRGVGRAVLEPPDRSEAL